MSKLKVLMANERELPHGGLMGRTLAELEPERAIRNALERLTRAAVGTPFGHHVEAERVIIEKALEELRRRSDE